MADSELTRSLVIDDILAYQNILDERGVFFTSRNREQLSELPIEDLRLIERKLRDLARTPQ